MAARRISDSKPGRSARSRLQARCIHTRCPTWRADEGASASKHPGAAHLQALRRMVPHLRRAVQERTVRPKLGEIATNGSIRTKDSRCPSGETGRHKGLEQLSPRGETPEVTPVKVGEGPDRIPHPVELTPNQARRITTSTGRRREQTAGT